jgi:negative regulator of sigma E activity
MMEHEQKLKLQSYLDGELPEPEAKELANRLSQDQEAAALFNELQQTRKALAGFEEGVKLPESRDFYWSKIQREIERQEITARPPAASSSMLLRLRRFLVPATGLAVAALLALIATKESGTGPGDSSVETALEDSGAFTYHDDSAGATLVWLSYPAEEDANDNDLNSLD